MHGIKFSYSIQKDCWKMLAGPSCGSGIWGQNRISEAKSQDCFVVEIKRLATGIQQFILA
jgi:hypothetical protein